MTRRQTITTWLMLLLGAATCQTATAQYTVPPNADPSFTTIWNVANGNWTTPGNWIAGQGGNGGVPDVNNPTTGQDFALLNNAGTAIVNTDVEPQAGGVILGELAANSGTLDVQSGGILDVVDHPTFNSDGSVQVGRVGTGNLFVRRGGTLNAVSLSGGGQVGSTVTLGGTTGSGTATVNLTGAATLGRTTRVIGPNVAFNSASITLQGTSILIPELTAATHSPLKATGNAALAGTLQVDLNGASTASGSSWNLVDAATISGNFTSIVGDAASPLALGQSYRFRTVAGGNGQLGQLTIAQQLVLNVDRDSGVVSITNVSNAGATGVATDGYTVQSTNGSLSLANWQSLQTHPGVAGAGWEEANPTANRVSELRSSSTSTLGVGNAWGLGNLYQPPAPTQFGVNSEDLVFQYNDHASQTTVTGAVNYTGSKGINNLVVFADPTTGNVKIRNTSPFTVAIDAYTIASAGASLNSNPALWTSLQDTVGATWSESNLSDNRVSELKSSSETSLTLNGGTTFDLGNLFKTASPKDLVFQFLLSDSATTSTGVVLYEAAPTVGGVLGDYNKNGVVDAADYTVWRDKLGQPGSTLDNRNPANSGNINPDDYAYWKSRFGATSGSGSFATGSSPVPEPATAWLAFVLCGSIALAVRRRSVAT
jgi:hypothetical protein